MCLPYQYLWNVGLQMITVCQPCIHSVDLETKNLAPSWLCTIVYTRMHTSGISLMIYEKMKLYRHSSPYHSEIVSCLQWFGFNRGRKEETHLICTCKCINWLSCFPPPQRSAPSNMMALHRWVLMMKSIPKPSRPTRGQMEWWKGRGNQWYAK